ncbi:hypothetical protein SVIO_063330 [Streptomyces violaceusniger]|uniref:Histidine kinase/HSP90-like ATPase domain-containing protein n=1 Tax=Streptomyces violaceusniger TaxID=68280 RepID=A0A4D4L9J9_STRVO|nr:hypothetical protein SVIO_063330 [Streptomyces violaceusniger]
MAPPGEYTLASRGAKRPARAENRRPPAPATYPVRTEEDLLTVRHAVRAATVEVGFGLVDQTRVVTAASELARNAYVHGRGGTVTLEYPREPGGRRGLRLVVKDEGPGIADLDAALTDGFTTGGAWATGSVALVG